MDFIYAEVLAGALLSGMTAFLFWKIRNFDTKDYLTREQIEKIVHHRSKHLQEEYDKLEMKIDHMSTQIVQIGVTLARIDERMKKQ